MRTFAVALVCLLFACGGAAMTPDAPNAFDAAGLRLVVGVARSKTFVVSREGEVVSSQTGATAMKFNGRELRLPDGSKTLLALDGDELVANGNHVGRFDGDKLTVGDMQVSIRDDGVVDMTRGSDTKKMRLHFEGSVVGHRRPALMLVLVVFAIYVAANPGATFERFADD